MSNAVYHPAV
jgi:hypothetical protein